MSWQIPLLGKTKDVPSLALVKWFLSFVFILVVILFVCFCFYFVTDSKSVFYYGIIITVALFLLFGVAVGINALRISLLSERNEMIILSNKKIEDACRQWTSEFISVIGFSYAFPEEIEVEKLRSGEQFKIVGDKIIKFQKNIDYVAIFQEVLSSLRYKIMALTEDNKLEINFVVSSELISNLWMSFSIAWRNLQMNENAVEHPVFVVHSFHRQIETWLESDNGKSRLVVVCNPLTVDDPELTTTDGACAWLLAPTQAVAPSVEIFRLYRALVSQGSLLKSDLTNLIKYQDGVNHPDNLWFSEIKSKETVNEVIHQCNNIVWLTDKQKEIQQYFTRLVYGGQGCLDIWMAVTLAYLKCESSSSVNLVVSQRDSFVTIVQVRSMLDDKELL